MKSFSYKNPFKNRRNTRTQKLLTKLEQAEAMNAKTRDGISMARLPRVSARKPQRWDDKINPTYPIADRIPLSLVVMFKSHWAIGSTKLIAVSSMKELDIRPPASGMRMKLNFPNPVFDIASSKEKLLTVELLSMLNETRLHLSPT